MLLEHESYSGVGMDAVVTVCSRNTTVIWFGDGCSGHRMLLEHERYYGLGMDALESVGSSNTNVIMIWACMLWSEYALGTRTLFSVGMDALVIACSSCGCAVSAINGSKTPKSRENTTAIYGLCSTTSLKLQGLIPKA